jgi:phosphoserine phosphatase
MVDAACPRSAAAPADAAPSRLSVAEIIARLDVELERLGGGVLATDADGTLWDGDIGVDLFEALIAVEGVREAARDALAADAAQIGLTIEDKSPTSLAARLYAAFETESYPDDRAYAMMAWVFAGWHQDEVVALAERVLDEGRIEARIRPEMQTILRWAEARRVPIYVVSASPIAIVEAAVARLGSPVARAFGTTPAVREDRVLLPCLEGPLVYGEGKVRVLLDRDLGAPILAAFGDSHYDAAMLRASRVPVAVTPAPHLVAVMPTIAGIIELTRGAGR